jgi:TrmH family RNA methyltransferase
LDDLIVVLVAPRNPLNIGAAARAMQNFGVETLRVVNPYEVAFREAVSAVSAGPILKAAQEFPDVGEAVADCTLVVGTTSIGHRELQHPLRLLPHGAPVIRRTRGKAALLFGSEKFGLSNEEISHCHWLMRIPTVSTGRSMNLGQAVAVCLYEIAGKPLKPAQPESFKAATMGEVEQITQMLIEAGRRSGYVNPVVAVSTEAKVRRMVRRLKITARDVPMWLGILRQVLWKLGGTPE